MELKRDCAPELQTQAENQAQAVTPPTPESRLTEPSEWDVGQDGSSSSKTKEPAPPLGIVSTIALLGALLIGGWLFTRMGVDETAHDDWGKVSAAASASDEQGSNMLLREAADGGTSVVPVMLLSTADLDVETTIAVRKSLIRRDLDTANAELHNAHADQNSGASEYPDGEPSLESTPDLVKPLRDGRAKFYHLHLMDCCDEDGDVVQISVNGQPYTTIGLTHAGATISVPLTSGVTTLTLTGVHDGGGGITVQFSTSGGDYFSRPMQVGEDYHIGVAAP